DIPRPPPAEIVAAGVARTINGDVVVRLVQQELLDRLIRTVGVTYDDVRATAGNVSQPLQRLGAETRDLTRAADEHGIHWLLRVRVMVRARTAAALPVVVRRSVMAFIVAPERNKSSNSKICLPLVCATSTACNPSSSSLRLSGSRTPFKAMAGRVVVMQSATVRRPCPPGISGGKAVR